MKCIKCGCEIADDCIFCTECGASQDGRIKCSKCGTLNSPSNVHCEKCKARLDGKEYCAKCGALCGDGEFCSECGARISKERQTTQNVLSSTTAVNQNVAVKKSPFEIYKRVQRIVSPCALLFIMFVLFCCSFGVGFSVNYYGTGDFLLGELGIMPKTGGGILYFFTQSFVETKAIINSEADLAGNALARFGLQLPNVISLIAVLGNFITILTLFIISGIKTGIALKKGENPNIYKYVISAFVCFFATAVIVKEINYVYMDYIIDEYYSQAYYYVSMNVGSILGMVFSIPLFMFAFVIEQIGKGKEFSKSKNLTRVIFGIIITLFTLIVIGFMGEGVIIDVRAIEGGNLANTEYSISSLLSYLCFKLANNPTINYSGQFALYLISMIIRLGGIVVFGVLLRMSIGLMFEEKNYAKPMLITIIIAIVLCGLTSIIPICLYVEMINNSLSSVLSGGGLGAGINATTIISLVVLGGVITYFVLEKKSEKQR